ncbi:MAG TPA: hypothetical protein VNZ22_02915, partial [Bacillota bacterium]|nr:hypothetical protein [Bacillota bacterium]
NTATRELLKRDEAPIQACVDQIRARLYQQPLASSPFAAHGSLAGMFKQGSRPLPPEQPVAAEAYLRRYTDFFAGRSLRGLRLVAYQHSAVGRDLLVQLLEQFGAEVIPAGRSETFVPIDTEAIDEQQLGIIQELAAAAWREHGPIDAVVSTDGDSDRPLILGVEPVEGTGAPLPCRVRFFGGDLVGMVVAEYLGADAVVVPISCNDAVDRGGLKEVVQPKTRIGSPFVIAGMEQALAQGRQVVSGWEANGGFLLGSNITREGRTLRALPTRDAFLPLLAVLLSAKEKGIPVSALFDRLPRRFSRAALLKQFPRATSLRMLGRFRPADQRIEQVWFENGQITAWDGAGAEVTPATTTVAELNRIRGELEGFFTAGLGFGSIVGLNYTDGVRLYFSNGDVAHMRPSGNADELRIYTVADSQERANAIAQLGVSEPEGILRRIERTA